MKRVLILFSAVIFAGSLAGCLRKDDYVDPSIKDQFFDFSNTHLVNMLVDYNLRLEAAPAGSQRNAGVDFDVYIENPYTTQNIGGFNFDVKREDLNPVFHAIADASGKFQGDVSLPTYVKKVYLCSNYYGVPAVMEADVVNNGITVNLSVNSRSTSPTTRTGTVPNGFSTLGGWDGYGKPDYLAPRVNLPAFLFDDAMYSLPDERYVRSEYLGNSEVNTIRTKEATTVNMVFVHQGGQFLNTVGYYTYPTGNPPATVADIQKRTIAFPDAAYAGPKGSLASGDNVQLKYWNGTQYVDEFPANTTIAFFIITNAFNVGSGNITYSGGPINMVLYSDSYLNTSVTDSRKQHNVAMWDRDRKVIVVGFEDIRRDADQYRPYNDSDFNDVIFYMTGKFVDDNPPLIPDPTPGPDPDENYFTVEGLLAFEDLWPYSGDYDMNDLAIEYNSKVYRDANNKVTKIVDTFYPKWTGASYKNAFGYQLGIDPSKIKSANIETTYPGTFSNFNRDSKFLEIGQSKATFILFENMNDVMGTEEGPVSDPRRNSKAGLYTFKVTYELTSPTSINDITFPPYNPFIVAEVPNNIGRKEVHLPNYKPTDAAALNLFRTGQDRSIFQIGVYYVADSDFPFAIHIPRNDFFLPKETQRIDLVYPRFSNWVASRGQQNADWYMYPAN